MALTSSDHKTLFIGVLSGSVATLAITTATYYYLCTKNTDTQPGILQTSLPTPDIVEGVDGLIGNTPLMKIRSLSEATGCTILGKAEFLNPGGSAKDRVALNIIRSAEEAGILKPHTGSTIFEGTVGSTGISIAMIARAKGYKAWIVMPDDQAKEKYQLLEKLGATVEKVRPVSIIDKKQFVNLARERAHTFGEGETKGYFADQFENQANFQIHYNTTGPELYRQSGGKIDALVLGAGTGGTLSGLACYLKPLIHNLKVFLADPSGSGLYNKIKFNVMYSPYEREGTRRRHQVDTVVEGIGINRLTRNFDVGRHLVDDAFRVTDEEAVKMARYLVREDGLFIGSSSAVNCVAAVRAAKQLGPGHVIVTLLNDSGQRHLTKFWSDEYLASQGINYELKPDETVMDFV
ncbi:tryptophan synthase beta subunit-like PLP-dependent enzyme [Radiomyces spectabilis]|uniref:tryptophan synthase beta subunit-like PLP-dependent enzyme n=1 Tax=Radiomyces spectabilis TaxID=64574 RepID=UPI0022205BC9|nr:tryptophan synthase beta subunit-like PLP-dependent enzyme [Radiomyces spectabilis]KAI8364692.1 tryptophan synthase beta subunit-like PLP-dependent enzyme [Radiomyces spectabilis]